MRWRGGRRSQNVEDRRGAGGVAVGGGIGAIVLTLIALAFGVDPGVVLQGGNGAAPPPTAEDDETAQFVSTVLAYTEDVWQQIFQQEAGEPYREPTLVLFSGATQSSCGLGQAAMGPFYCPLDQNVYIDLSFFRDLDRLGAPGDFAQAYVIAHEVGHHVQTLLGISQEVRARSQQLSQGEANALSVRQELQADCFAGVWANRAHQMAGIIQPGDIEEALGAASAIGDDRLQRQGQGYVVPESFTHGTSAQRVRWFRRGFESGDPEACDTFSAADL